MTEIIEGDIIAAPSPSEMTAWKSRITALEASDPERAELEITDALTFSNEMLRAVSDVTAHEPTTGAHLASAGIGAAKLTAVRAAEFAKRLDLSKDTRLEAEMQIRRWERATGVATRAGQAAGEIETEAEARERAGRARHRMDPVHPVKPKPTDFATQREWLGNSRTGAGIYALTDGSSDEQFDAALSEAKSEGNVSRANVVRKLRDARVVDIATGEVYDPEAITPENRAEVQAERERMLGLFTDAQTFTGALNRLHALHSPRTVAHYLEVHRVSQSRPDFATQHHNPTSIRQIAQYLNDYANALEEQS